MSTWIPCLKLNADKSRNHHQQSIKSAKGITEPELVFGQIRAPPKSHQAVSIDEVAVVKNHSALPVALGILVKVLDPAGVEGAASSDDAVDLVALVDEELGQVAAVLSGDAGDEGHLTTSATTFQRHFRWTRASERLCFIGLAVFITRRQNWGTQREKKNRTNCDDFPTLWGHNAKTLHRTLDNWSNELKMKQNKKLCVININLISR